MNRTTRLFAAAAIASLLALPASTALAFNPSTGNGCSSARWPASMLPSPWYLNQAGSDNLPFNTVESIMQQSWAAWDEPCCSSFSTSYEGTTQLTALSDSQNNVISFRESNWPSTLGDPSGVIAVTPYAIWSDCTIRNADIVYNGVNKTYVNGEPQTFTNEVDLMSVTVHEMGHWLGLDHSDVRGSSVWWQYSNSTDERTLHQDDIDGVCFLYNKTCSCASDSDCGSNEECSNGTCVRAACTSDADCQSPLVCRTSDGQCVPPPCTSDADCGAGFTCDNGTCVANNAGCSVCATCSVNQDCGSNGICASFQGVDGARCTQLCNDGVCPGDSVCYTVTATDGSSYPLCLNPDAESGICPSGYTCDGGTASGGCAGLGNDCSDGGSQCSQDNDICLDDGTNVFCSCVCGSDADCGADGTCEQLADGSFACVPGQTTTAPCGGSCGANEVCDPATDQCVSSEGCPGLGNDCANQGELCTSVNDACVTNDGVNTTCTCRCTSDADCGSGNSCTDIGGGNSVCVQGTGDPCAGVTCGAGETCNPTTGQCESSGGDTGMTDTSTGTDTSGGTDTSTGTDTSAGTDTSTGGTDTTGGADTAGGDAMADVGGNGGGDDDCSCGAVRAEPESTTPWAGLTLLALAGVVVLRRRRRG